MNKRILIVIIVVVLLLLFLIINYFISTNKNINIDLPKEKHILIEKSHENNAWGYKYSGIFICTDGTMYKTNSNKKADTLLEKEKYIINDNNKMPERIDIDDIKKIYYYSKSLKNIMIRKPGGNDMGTHLTKIWYPEKNKTITIKESGDFNGTNKTKSSKEILRILDKY